MKTVKGWAVVTKQGVIAIDHWFGRPRFFIYRARKPQWQDISTAPGNAGPKVDIWCDGRRYQNCYWDNICKEYRTTENSGILIRLRDATHWMPQPPPPEDKP